jgi:hypothetical protein
MLVPIRRLRRFAQLVTLAIGLCAPTMASAVLIRVDWSATLLPSFEGNETGYVTGSFGTFDVQNLGDAFVLPMDGSLTATTSGYSDFPTSIPLTSSYPEPPVFRFGSLAPLDGDVTNNINPEGQQTSFTGSTDCGPGVFCGIEIQAPADGYGPTWVQAVSGTSFYGGIIGTGLISYTFTAVPEPAIASLLLLGFTTLAGVRSLQVSRTLSARRRLLERALEQVTDAERG